ncbi:uncharacterized protein LOC122537822 [Frieseomelitta varia]|uniref:uncharacterized protein LOC122537822 n=1 Tax=Frieseomelitta varia TaxID=561572 RepID=UPI001CB67CF4|nr:uncharacterized protein LOC122537822 [Frieseomelitta varia]
MLCNSETDRDSKTFQILYLTLFLFCTFIQLSIALSVSDTNYNTTLTNNTSNNSTGDDLYVIKAMVYEIGILTDADNATNDTTERQEVKLSFYNPPTEDNGS